MIFLPSAIAPSPSRAYKLVALLLVAAAGAITAFADNPPTTINVDAAANRHPISPNIYGQNWASPAEISALNAPLNRYGGNANSRYNWEIDAHSTGSDWYFETYSDGDGTGTPGGSVDKLIGDTRSAGNGVEPMITIPMLDYLAKLGPNRSTLAGFSVKKYGAQQATDPWNSDAGNGVSLATGKNITGNDPLDTGVANSPDIQKAWVQHLVSKFGNATSPTGVKYYVLDNEPSVWVGTHRDVHPNRPGYDEMYNKVVSYASAIRSADPSAQIVGIEEWCWWAMYVSGIDQGGGNDYASHGNVRYYPWLLQKLAAYKQQTGVQLVDILSVHGYTDLPDFTSSGGDDSLTAQQVRNRHTRLLWDPNYKTPYWWKDIGINGGVINWIPTLRGWVDTYYPGLKIAFTEYSWGNETKLNGATTQADVLGIYGREGLDMANRWGTAKDSNGNVTVTFLASQIYRNYDGHNSTFGDTSVSAAIANPDNLSAFAAVRGADGALTVLVINKQQGSTPVTVNLAGFSAKATAQTWQINSAAQTAIAQLADVAVNNNALTTTVPSQSITLFVIPNATPVPVYVAPVFTTQPLSQTITTGGSALFTAAASGNPAPSFQWEKGGNAIMGATTSTYAISPVSSADAGVYTVVATNSAGTATSTSATLTVNAAPQIAAPPVAQTVPPGKAVAFSVSVSGTPAPTAYQWQRLLFGANTWTSLNDSGGFSGTSTATLQLTDASLAMNGDQFRCIVTNALGATTSAPAALVVAIPATWARSILLMNRTTVLTTAALDSMAPTWRMTAAADFNADGKTDIIWQNIVTGEHTLWLMNGNTPTATVNLGTTSPTWLIAGTGDFNGDGKPDILWQNVGTGQHSIWLMNGTANSGNIELPTTDPIWRMTGTGDFNGDGQTDILWQNIVTGQHSIWLMAGTTNIGNIELGTTDPIWRIPGTGDFNGDGQTDILWQNTITGQMSLWLMNGTTVIGGNDFGAADPSTQAAAVGDFNADGKVDVLLQKKIDIRNDLNGDGFTDILWQNTATGQHSIWLMNGTTYLSNTELSTTAPVWQIAGTGDFNADGQTDILWHNLVTGQHSLWSMKGTTYQSGVDLETTDPLWQIAGTGDFNGNGQTDILFQNVQTGQRTLWLMTGTTHESTVDLGITDVAWQMVGTGDFNADSHTDILWQNTVTGQHTLWLMTGTVNTGTVDLGTTLPVWQMVATGDFNGDGSIDILWQNIVTGQHSVWLMNGTTAIGNTELGTTDPSWQIVN